ncbi:hypothetical protein F383_05955 [Gossypium arboreum]|uniref:Uncharacterized protein n=1 Tax=Gossypium arboreum TaxID=29729 RepID=A0A0B0PB90_GOSAR|nr:hypothetical protein F383_05955 [Gossypium arboreum]
MTISCKSLKSWDTVNLVRRCKCILTVSFGGAQV